MHNKKQNTIADIIIDVNKKRNITDNYKFNTILDKVINFDKK